MNLYGAEDNKGNYYFKVGGKATTKGIISKNGENQVFNGVLNFSLRERNSIFGKELVIQFKLGELLKRYPSSSAWSHIEFYLPEELAKEEIQLLNKLLNPPIKKEKQIKIE